MTIEQAIPVATGTDDAHAYEDGTGWSNSTTTVFFRSRTTTNFRSGGGFRFKIPADIPASAIETASLRITSAGTATWSGTILAERIPAAEWANTAQDRPYQRATAALAAGTPSTAVTFNQASPVLNTAYTSTASSALADDIKAAMNHGSYVAGTSYVSVIFRGATTNADFNTVHSFEGAGVNTERLPYLVLNLTNLTPSTQTITPTVVKDVLHPVATEQAQYNRTMGVSYHDGIGNSTNRTLDITVPTRPAPAGGWPIVMFIHGGSWNVGTSQSEWTTFWRRDLTVHGFATVSINYKLTEGTLTTNTGWTHPAPVQDALCAAQWLVDNADKYGMSSENIIVCGYSAGGNVALETALAAQDPNRDTYLYGDGGVSGTLDRYSHWTASDPDGINPVSVTQGRTRIPQFAGCFLWAPPVSLTAIFTYNWLSGAVANMVDLYWGQVQNNTATSQQDKEGDLDAMIEGRAATIYAASPALVPAFPIGLVYDATDVIVPTSASHTALKAALDIVGTDTTAGSGVVNVTNNAYSRYLAATAPNNGHDYVMSDTESTPFALAWFDAVKALHPKRGQGYPRGDVFPRTTGQGWPRQRRPGAI